MHKIVGIISGVLFSFSSHAMDLSIEDNTSGIREKASSKIVQKTLREIVDSTVSLLALGSLTEEDKKHASQNISLLTIKLEEFLTKKQQIFQEQGQIKKQKDDLAKKYRAYKDEYDAFESKLTALRVPRVDEITSFLKHEHNKKDKSAEAVGPESYLVAKHSNFLQKRAEFLKQRHEQLQKERDALEKVSKAIGSITTKLSSYMSANLGEQQRLQGIYELKERERQELSAARHGCLLLRAILKFTVLKQPLTKEENEAFSKGGTIRESIINNPDFLTFVNDVDL